MAGAPQRAASGNADTCAAARLAPMIAFALRATLAVAALVAALAAWRAADPAAAALEVIGAFIALHGLVVLTSFALSRRHACKVPPALRVGLPRAAAIVLLEWLAHLVLFVVVQPFERAWMGDDAPPTGPGSVPVLLVHGYMCNRGTWWWIRRKLEAAGIAVATINLEPPGGSIDDHAGQLAARIEAICGATGAARVALVGHSMGGLVARAYLRKHGGGRVSRLVTLATPHHGTWVAYWGVGRNAREMEPQSAFIRALATAEPGVPALSIWTPTDNFVAPQDSSRLAGARERIVPASSHLALLFAPDVAKILLSELAHDQTRQR